MLVFLCYQGNLIITHFIPQSFSIVWISTEPLYVHVLEKENNPDFFFLAKKMRCLFSVGLSP